MKIFLTGASGQVGSAILDKVQDNRHAIDTTRFDLIDESNKACHYIHEQNFDFVINAAAYTAVDKAETREGARLSKSLNAMWPIRLAEICSSLDIPLLHISTDYVFDGQKPGSYVESDICNPLSVYGKHKHTGEGAVASLDKYYLLRTSWVYSQIRTNFVKTMLRLGLQHKQLSIVNDQFGGPTSASQIADVILRMLASDQYGLYHFTAAPPTCWYTFALKIFSIAGQYNPAYSEVQVTPITTKKYIKNKKNIAPRPHNSRLDCSKVQQCFGISQPCWEHELAVAIANMLK